MLDHNLLSFVEPIGYGQIVDRESLVALPLGSIKLQIKNSKEDITVKVLSFRSEDNPRAVDREAYKRVPVKAYVWQDGVVVSGEELYNNEQTVSRARWGSVRHRPGPCMFRFRKHPDSCNIDEIVHGVLQICVHNFAATKLNPKRKIFVGTAHIALKCFRCDDIGTREDWYKVFPKSTMLPGSPSEIAKDNCYINGEKVIEEQADVITPISDRSSCADSESTISFDIFKVRRKSRRRSLKRWFSFSASNEKDITEEEFEQQSNEPNNMQKSKASRRESIYKWLRAQKFISDNSSPSSSRLSHDSLCTSCSHPPVSPPFLVSTSSSQNASKRSSLMSSSNSVFSNNNSITRECGHHSTGDNVTNGCKLKYFEMDVDNKITKHPPQNFSLAKSMSF